MVLQLCEIQRNLYPDAFPFVDDLAEPFASRSSSTGALPGHIWFWFAIRRITIRRGVCLQRRRHRPRKDRLGEGNPGMDLSPLLIYFKNRDVWVYEPDEDDSSVTPYKLKQK